MIFLVWFVVRVDAWKVYAWKVDAAAVVCLVSVILFYVLMYVLLYVLLVIILLCENSFLLVFIRDRGMFWMDVLWCGINNFCKL